MNKVQLPECTLFDANEEITVEKVKIIYENALKTVQLCIYKSF